MLSFHDFLSRALSGGALAMALACGGSDADLAARGDAVGVVTVNATHKSFSGSFTTGDDGRPVAFEVYDIDWTARTARWQAGSENGRIDISLQRCVGCYRFAIAADPRVVTDALSFRDGKLIDVSYRGAPGRALRIVRADVTTDASRLTGACALRCVGELDPRACENDVKLAACAAERFPGAECQHAFETSLSWHVGERCAGTAP